MSENHATTAVAIKLEMVHGVAFGVLLLDEVDVNLPLVADYFAAGEAAHGDDHVEEGG